jgi:hypothetical protein
MVRKYRTILIKVLCFVGIAIAIIKCFFFDKIILLISCYIFLYAIHSFG